MSLKNYFFIEKKNCFKSTGEQASAEKKGNIEFYEKLKLRVVSSLLRQIELFK
ncbi:hypothetical protein [Methanosarcina horonobensis]|uniref:hypothetical protein n=1 Tax=Methanosarcina horonobensis TaxID=418008 RepID=UPI0022B92282|nr:hypothetical protein [Methanosarcina horonobensis]